MNFTNDTEVHLFFICVLKQNMKTWNHPSLNIQERISYNSEGKIKLQLETMSDSD